MPPFAALTHDCNDSTSKNTTIQLTSLIFHFASDAPSGAANLNEQIDNVKQNKRKRETPIPYIHALETDKKKR